MKFADEITVNIAYAWEIIRLKKADFGKSNICLQVLAIFINPRQKSRILNLVYLGRAVKTTFGPWDKKKLFISLYPKKNYQTQDFQSSAFLFVIQLGFAVV